MKYGRQPKRREDSSHRIAPGKMTGKFGETTRNCEGCVSPLNETKPLRTIRRGGAARGEGPDVRGNAHVLEPRISAIHERAKGQRDRNDVADATVSIGNPGLFLLRIPLRGLMPMIVMSEMPRRHCRFVLAIASRCRPGELERQNEQQTNQKKSTHPAGGLRKGSPQGYRNPDTRRITIWRQPRASRATQPVAAPACASAAQSQSGSPPLSAPDRRRSSTPSNSSTSGRTAIRRQKRR